MKASICLITAVAAINCVGCSTITQSENQSVSLSATYEGKSVDPTCQIKNDKGSWESRAPASLMVRKSNEDLEVTCRKDGMPDGTLKAISRAAGSMFGNIILGGGIGALIDHNKGTGYNYPDLLPVKMGETVVIDRNEPNTQTAKRDCSSEQTC